MVNKNIVRSLYLLLAKCSFNSFNCRVDSISCFLVIAIAAVFCWSTYALQVANSEQYFCKLGIFHLTTFSRKNIQRFTQIVSINKPVHSFSHFFRLTIKFPLALYWFVASTIPTCFLVLLQRFCSSLNCVKVDIHMPCV